jgi:hypothetical protein
MLYHPNVAPKRAIAPVMAHWQWQPKSNSTVATIVRKIWIWVHAAAFEEAYQMLCQLVSSSTETTHTDEAVVVRDLRHQMLVFDFTGPRTMQYLSAVLQPCQDQSEQSQVSCCRRNTVTANRMNRDLIPVMANARPLTYSSSTATRCDTGSYCS